MQLLETSNNLTSVISDTLPPSDSTDYFNTEPAPSSSEETSKTEKYLDTSIVAKNTKSTAISQELEMDILQWFNFQTNNIKWQK